MTYLVTVEQLIQLQQETDVVLIDVRSHLQQPQTGKEKYDKGHLPGAFFLDMEEDLSGKVAKHGGNHPLPDVEKLAIILGSLGVYPTSTVVVYDDSNGMFAARALWLLQFVGHPSTMILEGGYQAWMDAGHDVTTAILKRTPTTFIPHVATDEVVSMEEVKNRPKQTSVLIDSRAYARYIGESEPLYKKAGHIPGAKHYFWQDVLDESKRWKEAAELKTHFQALKNADEIIVSCGSGISACPNVIALKMAGFTNVKLYPGSYSDWISYEENDVVTGEE